MNLKTMLPIIARQAGDPKYERLSKEIILDYLSESQRIVAKETKCLRGSDWYSNSVSSKR